MNNVGNKSMEAGVKVIAEDLQSREKRHTNSCYFTMVAKDANGNAVRVPPLEVETEIERRLFEAGKMRKEMRRDIIARNQQLHVKGLDEELGE